LGPLSGIKVIELTGVGPGPFAATLLADMGAEVVRVERVGLVDKAKRPSGMVFDARGRRSVAIDLKRAEGVECLLRLVAGADALIEPFRPGVAERLGIGPDACLGRNSRLIYARMTGWGQDGPLAYAAAHDINYISIAGALAHFGRAGEPPTPPLNMVGDYGGGGMFLAFGVVCGILEARSSGEGQVIDVAMVDGIAYLMGVMWGLRGIGELDERRGVNLLDTGAPFYDVYETADGEFVSIGSLEPQFYAELIERTGLSGECLPGQHDRAGWPEVRARLAELVRGKTRAEWVELLEGTDVCFAPVLRMSEMVDHPHIVARHTLLQHDGMDQPAPAPRFSRTIAEIQGPAPRPGMHTDAVLAECGFTAAEIAELAAAGTVKQATSCPQ
jgi:alpha-methylacyl-CoA racemase